MKIDLKDLSIEKAHNSLKNGEYKVSELVDAYLEVIKEKNEELNAYLEIFKDDIEPQVKIAEEMFKNGTATKMTGIPIAIKDNILFEGHIASAASKILESHRAVYDSFVIMKLKKEGVVILGRTNMDDSAMGSSTETSAYGVTRNPFDTTRVPGGSSGGSAVAVAANMALVSLGTETCGSVRQPSSFCGLVGMKPTYGAVSRNGIIAMGSSLDQVGPMGKTIEDVEILYNSICGKDALDSTSLTDEFKLGFPKTPLKKRIGVPRDFLNGGGIDEVVIKNFEESCEKLKKAGYEIVDVHSKTMQYSLAVYYIIMPAEVSSNLARYDGMRYGFSQDAPDLYGVYSKSKGGGYGKEVRRRILLGTYILSHGYYDAYYNKAINVRDMIAKELLSIFEEVDAIITPTVPFPAFKLGDKMNDPMSMYMCDIFSAPANLAGIPAISIPSGNTKDGLPLGLQITAPYLREDVLFTIGKDFEKLV
ncbi:MAG: Asp-tRNA(Asn)/Glu-tRNA(Gln) amidotransferase subunit GatA [Candidatus Nomurabacteria bacterium]|nr:Asp-tRNA(Asn)/Glu-tRNA(Gln) amidotransferase subunit GatA [Candidatus Nomurabacteria bacterium]